MSPSHNRACRLATLWALGSPRASLNFHMFLACKSEFLLVPLPFQGPILDACWSDDGTKVFMASCDKQVKCWDLATNQALQVAEHGAPVKSVRWVKAPNYTALMTGSWDKTLKGRMGPSVKFVLIEFNWNLARLDQIVPDLQLIFGQIYQTQVSSPISSPSKMTVEPSTVLGHALPQPHHEHRLRGASLLR